MSNELVKQEQDPDLSPTAQVSNTAGKLFLRSRGHIEKSLVGKLTYDLLVSAALNSIRKTPDLKKCTQSSMLAALVHCAEVGLLPDTPSQHCHLIPYYNGKMKLYEVQWMSNWRGLIELARRSGEVKGIYSEVVYRDDEFSYRRGYDPDLVHIPNLESQAKDDDDITYFYAVVFYKDGWKDFEVMTKAQVDAIRGRAQAKAGPAWTYFYSEQGRKTVIKRLSKRQPLSPEFAKAADLDDRAVMGESQEIDLPELAEVKSKTEQLADDLAKKAAKIKKTAKAPTDVPEPLDTIAEEVPPETENDQPEPPEEVTEAVPEEVETVPAPGQNPRDFGALLDKHLPEIPSDTFMELKRKYAAKRVSEWTPMVRSQEYAKLTDIINEFAAREKAAAAEG